jgi:alpha-glucosidase
VPILILSPRVRIKIQVVGAVFSALFVSFIQADEVPVIQALPDGIACKLSSGAVELRVASPHAFCLHVFEPDFPAPKPSIFLSGEKMPATPFTVTHDGNIAGIKTAFGELRLDTLHQSWSLSDASGAPLTGWAQWGINDFKSNPNHLGGVETGCNAVPGATGAVRYYGSGSVPNLGSLLETQSDSISGNGFASLPQFWSTAGYGALIIGPRDDLPTGWISGPTGIHLGTGGADLKLYLIPAKNLYDWLRGQAELTGFAPVPPRWALGYLQCRWGWKDKAYIDDTLAQFRKDQLPVDVFIFDFEWYTKIPDYQVPPEGKPDFVDFDWNPILFPDPKGQVAGFAQNGLRMVGIRKPRLGNSDNLTLARNKGWIIPSTSPDPSNRRNIDFSNPDLRAWYQDNLRKFDEIGVAGFWNDEGELRYDEYSYWNLAEFDLLKQVKPDARFWSLNRAFEPGLQRFGAATWSGDIGSDWATLANTPGQLLAYSLSGMPYSTCDIGGFGGEDTPELLTRWMQAGVFFGVMRSHSLIDRTPRFPWLYGPDAENAIRKALDLRYQLIPYYYSLAHENTRTAAPLMRALVMEFPDDDKVTNETHEWLMGGRLLVAPVMNPGDRSTAAAPAATSQPPPANPEPKTIPPAQSAERDVYLPKDTWFKFGANETVAGPQTIHVTAKLDEIPMYVRAGTLLPLGPVIQDTDEKSSEPLELQVYPGKDATFDLVEDDGATIAYRKGNLRITHFTWDDAARRLSWKTEGPYHGANCFRAVNAVLFSPQGKGTRQAELNDTGSLTFPVETGMD